MLKINETLPSFKIDNLVKNKIVHGGKLAVVLCSVNLCRHALPASTGRAAVVYTDQLLCLCWLEERAYKDSHYTAPPPTFHRV